MCAQRTGPPSRGISAIRVPSSGRQDRSDPPRIAAATSKYIGPSTSTTKRSVSAMSWIIIGTSTSGTAVGVRRALPSGPSTDHVRYGASSP